MNPAAGPAAVTAAGRPGDPASPGSSGHSFTVSLPVPPSVNAAWRNVARVGRVKTRDYARWQKGAILAIFAQVRADRRIEGNIAVRIDLPARTRGDLDNRLKPILDALVASRRIDDDVHVRDIRMTFLAPATEAIITVRTP